MAMAAGLAFGFVVSGAVLMRSLQERRRGPEAPFSTVWIRVAVIAARVRVRVDATCADLLSTARREPEWLERASRVYKIIILYQACGTQAASIAILAFVDDLRL